MDGHSCNRAALNWTYEEAFSERYQPRLFVSFAFSSLGQTRDGRQLLSKFYLFNLSFV
jgi:hypothetical protein